VKYISITISIKIVNTKNVVKSLLLFIIFNFVITVYYKYLFNFMAI